MQSALQNLPGHAWAWLVGGGLAVLGAFVAVVKFVAHSVAREIIDMHNADENAHGAAAERNHGPMIQKLDQILSELQSLREEHASLRAAHDVITGMNHGRVCVRATDPPNAVFKRKGSGE